MQGMNVASTLRKSQGQSELGRGSSPLAQHLQSGNGSRENVDAFSGLRINTGAPNQQQQRQDVMDLDNEDQGDESPDLGGHGMQDEMLEEDEEAEFSDEMSSSPSVPDEDIDFEHVYALHTFLATVEGQTTVTKGDSLDLLDDSNSYWWLVRVLNTQGVGYIPAENIETPHERLARLNKHRNVDIAMITKQDTEQGHTSAAARGRSIKPPTHGKPKKKAPVPLGPKSVNFGEPTYFEHSGGEYSEGSQDDYSFDYDEDDDERHVQGAFSDEDDEEPTSEDDEDMYNGEDHGDATVTDPPARMQKQSEIRPLQHHSEVRPLQPRPAQVIHQDSDSTVQGYNGQQLSPEAREAAQMRSMGMSVDDMLREQQPQYAPQPLQLRKPGGGQGQQQPLAPTRNGPQQELQSPKTIGRGSFEQGDTKKINLTPDIANTAPRDGPTPAPQQHYIPSPKQQQQLMAAQGMKTFAVPGPSTQEDEESMEGHSSVVSSSGSHTSSNSPQRLRKHSKSTGSVSSNENSPEDGNASPGKRKKSGGMFSGLFGRNKKDKEKKAGSSQLSRNNSVDRSSTPTQAQPHPDPSKQSSRLMSPEPPVVRRQAPPSMASLLPQSKNDQDDYLEPEAKQQQQIEAQNALYQQYGIQRPPGGHSNQFTPQSNRENLGLSSPAHANSAPATSKPLRPGSLLGSPAYPGLEAPTLSVLRVFSGDTVPVEATFKTVLLNESTSTSELLKQTLQRFRLPLDRIDDFYLVIQDVDQDQEKELQVTDKPLTVFQDLADEAHQARMVPPSVKRSSVSSISSASSNLSTHPAIAKLPMGDFSDDSAVKMYLHCKAITPRASIERQLSQSKTSVSNVDPETASTASSSATTTAPAAPASTPHDSLSANFGTRFAVKIAISSDDLPEGHMFDPQSAAIVPRQAIEHRLSGQSAASQGVRHKYIFFSTNSTVTQVIETALDRFAIMGGVVDGGDEVEDKLAKRRSITRTRYSLVQLDAQGSETRLQPSKRLLDSFDHPPIFKQQSSTTKETRRRSIEAAQMVASANDVQATDPVFYLRCASQRHHHQQSLAKQTRGPQATNSLQPVPEQQDRPGLRPSPSDMSVYATPSEEVPPDSELLPQQLPTSPSKQEIIAAQRAASRANQSAMISAQKNNSMGGVDITLRDRGTLRSSVVATDPNGQRRYSFIDANGAETDVSELVEAEWSSPRNQPDENRIRSPSALSTATTVTDAASFKSALQSPTRTASSTVDDEDAIAALRDAQLSIGNRPSSSLDRDHLQDALPKRSPSSETSEYSRRSHDIDDRISRVLAKVKQPHDRASSSLRNGRSSSASGRSSPAVSARDSPAQGHTTHSPAFSRSRTNSVEILNNASNGTRTPERLHSKQPSVSSSLSEATVSSQYSNGISNTVNTTATTVSPGVSARDHSRASQRLVYPADLGGVDHLLTILAPGPASYPNPTQLQNGAERLFGPDLHAHRQTLTDPEIRDWFDEKVGHLLDIEQRLDAVLDQLIPTLPRA